MTVLPVVARELRVASRRSWTYWGRVLAGGLALVLSAWVSLVGRALVGTRSGEPLFYALASPALGFAFLAGLLYAADSVSSEKRDGTLGLLFLTDLRGHDITLGKLAGNSLAAVYGLVAMLPFLALTLLMGGVAFGDYLRMVLLLLSALFASLATGVLASVITRDVRRSVLVAFFLMLGVFFGMPLACGSISWMRQQWGSPPEVLAAWDTGWKWYLTPLVGFGATGSGTFRADPSRYWAALGFTAGVGMAALFAAGWLLPRTWQEAAAPARRLGISGFLDRLRFPTPEALDQFRTAILDRAPSAWLTARHWKRFWLPWLFLLMIGAVTLWAYAGSREDWWDVEFAFGMSVLVHIVLKVWMANEAPRQFLEARNTGAMELLLSTSLADRDIVQGQWFALRRMFLGPMVAVLVADLVGILSSEALVTASGHPTMAIIWVLRMILLAADLWALAWAGMWAGMTGHGRAATSGIVSRILVLPWLAWIALATFVALSGPTSSNGDSLIWLLTGSWFFLGLFNDLLWWHRAEGRLSSQFREAATRPPGETRGWFRRQVRLES